MAIILEPKFETVHTLDEYDIWYGELASELFCYRGPRNGTPYSVFKYGFGEKEELLASLTWIPCYLCGAKEPNKYRDNCQAYWKTNSLKRCMICDSLQITQYKYGEYEWTQRLGPMLKIKK